MSVYSNRFISPIRYCDKEISPDTVFTSTGNEYVVLFSSYNYESVSGYTNPFRGFHANVAFIPGPDWFVNCVNIKFI